MLKRRPSSRLIRYVVLQSCECGVELSVSQVQEIKKLKHAISLVQGEKSKCKEALDDCERYRKVCAVFLRRVAR